MSFAFAIITFAEIFSVRLSRSSEAAFRVLVALVSIGAQIGNFRRTEYTSLMNVCHFGSPFLELRKVESVRNPNAKGDIFQANLSGEKGEGDERFGNHGAHIDKTRHGIDRMHEF